MQKSFIHKLLKSHQTCKNCPTPHQVEAFFNNLMGILFPNFSSKPLNDAKEIEKAFADLKIELNTLLDQVSIDSSDTVIKEFFDKLPEVYDLLQEDVTAIFNGDPAAVNREEVIRSYPGFYAISAYRIANSMHNLHIPSIPRSITELAHSRTGIDIHPAAVIGARFCIDHGTGVVIGETTEMGNDIKIYQGVTLGALSIDKSMAKTKRHPTIGNRVVIYAGATVLGGNTHIGDDSIIGGNVWLTESVPARSKVYYKATIKKDEISANKTLTIN